MTSHSETPAALLNLSVTGVSAIVGSVESKSRTPASAPTTMTTVPMAAVSVSKVATAEVSTEMTAADL